MIWNTFHTILPISKAYPRLTRHLESPPTFFRVPTIEHHQGKSLVENHGKNYFLESQGICLFFKDWGKIIFHSLIFPIMSPPCKMHGWAQKGKFPDFPENNFFP